MHETSESGPDRVGLRIPDYSLCSNLARTLSYQAVAQWEILNNMEYFHWTSKRSWNRYEQKIVTIGDFSNEMQSSLVYYHHVENDIEGTSF